jgi:hypothetical protein
LKKYQISSLARASAALVIAGIFVQLFQNCGAGFKTLDSASLDPNLAVLGKQTCSIGLLKNSTGIYRKNKQLVGNAINDIFGADVLKAVAGNVNSVAPDAGYVKNYESFVASITDAQVQSYDLLASSVASYLIAHDDKIKTLVGASCSSVVDYGTSSICLDNFRKKIIEPLYARILTDTEVLIFKNLYTGVVGTPAEKLEELIYFVMQDPRFYYSDMSDKREFVILRELARTIWYSVPDEKLMSAAQKPVLSSEDISALIESMLQDPKADRLLMAFFTQWLGLENLKIFNYGTSFPESIQITGLREAMMTEAKDFVRYTVIEKKGTLRDLFSSQFGKTNHPGLAGIYEVSASSNWQDLGKDRIGILSRGALLATGNIETKPILRGVHLTQEILCNPVMSPPADVVNRRFDTGIDVNNLSTRQLNDARVAQASCMGCHSMINPFGHALGVYDGLGRLKLEDRQFDGNGNFKRSFPLEPSIDLPLDGAVKSVPIGHEFLKEISESRQVSKCFDQQLFRFLAGQLEQETQSCGWNQMSFRTHQGTPIVDVIKDVLKIEMGGKVSE